MTMFQEKVQEFPLIAILRGIAPDEVLDVCAVLEQAGFRLLEIPLNSPDAVESVRRAAAAFHPGGRVLIGAGTVLRPEEATAVAEAGGTFVISPDGNPAVIRATKAAGLVSIPGFFTPTEAFAALRAGADYLKLFPAGALGPGYVRDLKAVIKAPILAVGGVTVENCGEFLRNCAGVGIGSNLYRLGKPLEAVRRDAEAFASAARPAAG